jgi:hypothetical protein
LTQVRDRQLSEAERKRLEKFKNTRGRKNPAKIPARLARTSAFAPKKTRLITDSKFERLYVVPGQSVIKVSGRELGTQHRDTIYALFRLPHRTQTVSRPSHGLPWSTIYETQTTWRGLLIAMGRTAHTNNLMTLMDVFEDIKKVVFTIFEGDHKAIVDAYRKGDLASLGRQGKGGMGSLIESIEWNGLELDSEVVIRYGDWSAAMMHRAKLVSLNADVQFELKSDYAKTFWPYIDSMNNHHYVDEDVLAALAGRDLWGEGEDKLTRGQFRRETKKAFEDMVRASGLSSYVVEEIGLGRRKSRRYSYVVAYPNQAEADARVIQEPTPVTDKRPQMEMKI